MIVFKIDWLRRRSSLSRQTNFHFPIRFTFRFKNTNYTLYYTQKQHRNKNFSLKNMRQMITKAR